MVVLLVVNLLEIVLPLGNHVSMRGASTGYLDGLRAFSALWVLVAHCLIWGGYEGFIPSAKLAVAVFMILSGYLMAHTARDFTQVGEWSRFYLKRFFRIAPLYYLVLVFVALSPWVREGFGLWQRFDPGTYYSPDRADFSPANLALHFSFLFGLSKHASTSTLLPDWSLSLEMQFYAVFPLIWLAIQRWGAARVCAALGLASAVVWVLARRDWHDPAFLLLQLPYFLAGIALHESKRHQSLAVLAVICATFEAVLYGPSSLVLVLTVAIIFLLDRVPAPYLRRPLDNPVMKFGGDVSYGIYLVHGLFIAVGGLFHLPLWALVPFVLCGSLTLSYGLHVVVERPAIAFGRALVLKRQPTSL